MMVTWHSLPTTVMKDLTAWKVPIPAAELGAFTRFPLGDKIADWL